MSIESLRSACVAAVDRGARLAALAVVPAGRQESGREEMMVVLADDAASRVGLLRVAIPPSRRYPALTTDLPQAHALERAVLEDHGIVPEGHPWPKPLRLHSMPGTRGVSEVPAPYPFLRVEGSAVHEVAVGPVHAGIIEPGHFRFQCHGEKVLHLEIQLGYQHRGAEALFLRSRPALRTVLAESLAGDTAVGHAMAHAAAMEGLAGTEPPLGAHAVRGIALELERVANHVGDLGALCGDVGFLPGAAWLGRLRGDFLNALLEISGNRFGRGLVLPGGVRFGIDGPMRERLLARLDDLERDFLEVSTIVLETSSVVSRFEQTGILSAEAARDLGVVGPAARASGLDRDVRRDHPAGIYRFAHVPVAVLEAGDVMARAVLRRTEAQRSIQFVRESLQRQSKGPLRVESGPLARDSCAVSLVEGWRGEIAHLAVTDAEGDLRRYQFVDPSVHNWYALAMVMRERQISDFPLCNKSFDLSYAGHDL
jgi:Ni,Fe-hydrogenase III large subunit